LTAPKILVVEDSAAIALDLASQLGDLGYDVVGVVSTGEDALRQIPKALPDAILMDIRLSGDMDGIETASQIPAAFSPAVIYLTGSSEEKTLNRARETQPYGYLLKPFSDRELHATIQIALERRGAAEILQATERRLEKANAALQAEINARIQSERRIYQMQAELLHVSRLSAMGQMTSTLAHEINQPLAAIGNYVRAGLAILESRDVEIPAKAKTAFEKAERQAERVSEVVDNLRAFVRKGDTTRRQENLSEVIADAITLAKLDAVGRSATIQLDLSADADCAVINRIQIQQVLVNLLRNAMEAMSGEVRLIKVRTCCADADFIQISVADTGPGLSADIGNDLFKPFVTTKTNGMGVGLAICQSIVDAHEGSIRTAPNPGGGAIFAFTVPRHPDDIAD
jgi:C4-dicarboxylate-specific signal transduction histidine kinase